MQTLRRMMGAPGASAKPNAFTDIVEQATSEANVSENWDLNLQICEMVVARQPDGPKEAAKAIKARVVTAKNPKVALLALSLLETCVNNCGAQFYHIVVTKDLNDYVKYAQTSGLDEAIRAKVLDLIQVWAVAMAADPAARPVHDEYERLRASGIPFPPRDLNEMTPVPMYPSPSIVPAASPPPAAAHPQQYAGAAARQPMTGGVVNPQFMAGPPPPRPMYVQPQPPGVVYLQPQQPGLAWYPQPPVVYQPVMRMQPPPVMQLQPQHQQQREMMATQRSMSVHDEVRTMKETVKVFGELVSNADPSQPVSENVLLVELKEQMLGIRARVSNMLADATDEQLIGTLLDLNDRINMHLDAYGLLAERRFSGAYGSGRVPSVAQTNYRSPGSTAAASRDLIDLGDGEQVQPELTYQQLQEMHQLVNLNDPAVMAEMEDLALESRRAPRPAASSSNSSAPPHVGTGSPVTPTRATTNPFEQELLHQQAHTQSPPPPQQQQQQSQQYQPLNPTAHTQSPLQEPAYTQPPAQPPVHSPAQPYYQPYYISSGVGSGVGSAGAVSGPPGGGTGTAAPPAEPLRYMMPSMAQPKPNDDREFF